MAMICALFFIIFSLQLQLWFISGWLKKATATNQLG
jgi:hypothetical protein